MKASNHFDSYGELKERLVFLTDGATWIREWIADHYLLSCSIHVGCGFIGSGEIESAHRTVIQKSMKLSGQRWSTKGVKNMLRLRVISMNR
jgi:hypothetical protein